MSSVRELAVMLRNYFETKYNVQANLVQNSENEFEIKFEEPVNLTERGYDELYRFLGKLGFLLSDSWEDMVNHRSYSGAEQYQSFHEQIIIYYNKVVTNEETTYNINGIIVEGAENEAN